MKNLAGLLPFALALSSFTARAQDRTWIGTTGPWNVSANWSGNAVPTAGSTATINNSGTATLGAGVSGLSGALFVGSTSNGSLSVDGGSLVNLGNAFLGNSAGSHGHASVSSGSWTNGGVLVIGGSGTGNLTMTGGLVTSSTTFLAAGVGSSGTLTLTSGTFATSRVVVGSGQGLLYFEEGSLQATANSADFLSGSGTGAYIGNGGATIDSSGFAITSTAALIGGGRLTKGGLGTLTLTGSNSYNGGTTVKSGTLVLDGGRINHGSSLLVGTAAGDNGSLLITNGGVLSSQGVSIGDAAGSRGSIIVQGGTLAGGSATMSIGPSGTGSLLINGGLVSAGQTYVGGSAVGSSGVGSVTLNSGTWQVAGALNVGIYSGGSVTINGGLATASSLTVGGKHSGAEILTMNGGTLSTGGIILGYGATMNITDGLVTNSLSASVGSGGSSGAVTVSGGTWNSAGTLTLGGDTDLTVRDSGVITVGGGSGTIRIGSSSPNLRPVLNIGAYDLSSTSGALNFGVLEATSSNPLSLNFNQTNAITVSASILGNNAISITQRGTGTTTYTGIGQAGGLVVANGTFKVDGGSLSNNGDVRVQSNLVVENNGILQGGKTTIGGGAMATALLESGTWIAGDLTVGQGNGSLTINDGLLSSQGLTIAPTMTQSLGIVTLNGGTLSTNGRGTVIGVTGTGVLNVNGGIFTTGSLSGGNRGTALINLSGGTLEVSRIASGTGITAFNFNGGTLRATGANASFVSGFDSGITLNAAQAVIDSNYAIGISSVLTGTGGLVKTGTGSLIVSALNTYTGTTNVAAGKLQVDGGLQSTAVNVSGGATLAGSGSIAGAVTVADGATLAPGSSPGTLTVGSLTLNNTSIFDFELSTPNVVGGGVNDLVSVNGNLVLDGILNVYDLTGFGAGTYRLFDYTGSLTDNGLLFGIVPGAFNLTVDSSVANQINLIVTAPTAQYWDGSNTTPQGQAGGTGGTGVWNGSSTNWTNANGNANSAWLGSTGAVFSGSSGTVTIADGYSATTTGLSFQTDGYTLAASGSGAVNLIGAGQVDVATGTATISAPITGTARLFKGGTGTLSLTGPNSYTGGTSIRAGTLEVSGAGSITHVAGDLAVGEYFGDNATLLISGSASISNRIGFIGANAGATGSVVMSGGTWTNAGELRVGDFGTGTLTITGGAITSTIGNIGRSAGSSGTVEMSGGTWTNSQEFLVGNGGAGSLTLTNGTIVSVLSTIGAGSGASGTASMTGGAWLNSGELRVGDLGNGTLTITNGTLTSTIGNIGRSAGSSGTVTMSGGTWTNSAEFLIGNGGSGSFALSGSGTVNSVLSSIGAGADGSGSATVSGGTWMNSGELRVGDFGTGSLTITGGSVTSTIGNIGRSMGSSGTVAMNGGTWVNSDQFLVGNAGNGVFHQTSGTVSANIGVIGAGSGATGVATVSGGRWENSSLVVGQNGLGTLNLTDTGIVSVNAGSGTLTLATNASSQGVLNLGTGGTVGILEVAEVTGGDGAALVRFDHTGSFSFAPKLSGSLAVTKLGPGTTTLTEANTYTGGTVISEGTLVIVDLGDTASALGTGAVDIEAGGTLAGVGTVLGDTLVAGTLAPGNSPGTIHFGGALTLNSTAMVQMELGEFSSDFLSVDGLLTYDGTLAITLSGGYRPEVGEAFSLFDAASVTFESQFDAITFDVAGYAGVMDYQTGVLTISAVPEPSTLALAGVALLVVAGLHRRASRH